MSEVVVIPDAEPEEGTAVAFAAGVATAEAAQASEEAAEALEVAEAAAATAETAVEIAIEATAGTGVTYEDLEQLRAEVRGELEELRGMVADAVIEGGAEEGPLTPERVEREEGPAPEGEEHDGQEEKTDSKSAGRYGNPAWFRR